jgi:hypothetical protein
MQHGKKIRHHKKLAQFPKFQLKDSNFLKFRHIKLVISRKFDICKNNLITTKLEKVLQYRSTFVIIHL